MKKILPILIFILTLSYASFSQCGIVGIPAQMLQGTSVGIQNTSGSTAVLEVISGNYPMTIGIDNNLSGIINPTPILTGTGGSIVADATTALGIYQIAIDNPVSYTHLTLPTKA